MVIHTAFAGVSVSHFVENAYENKEITVHVVIKPDSELRGFDVGEFLPETWSVRNWAVQNHDAKEILFESEKGEFMQNEYSINHWAFENLSDEIALSYTLEPKQAGEYEIVSVWFWHEGFEMDTFRFSVKEKPANMITGYSVSSLPSGSVKSSLIVRQSVSDVLSSVSSISLC